MGDHFCFAAQMSVDEARQKALANCRHEAQNNESCSVVSVDTSDVSL